MRKVIAVDNILTYSNAEYKTAAHCLAACSEDWIVKPD